MNLNETSKKYKEYLKKLLNKFNHEAGVNMEEDYLNEKVKGFVEDLVNNNGNDLSYSSASLAKHIYMDVLYSSPTNITSHENVKPDDINYMTDNPTYDRYAKLFTAVSNLVGGISQGYIYEHQEHGLNYRSYDQSKINDEFNGFMIRTFNNTMKTNFPNTQIDQYEKSLDVQNDKLGKMVEDLEYETNYIKNYASDNMKPQNDSLSEVSEEDKSKDNFNDVDFNNKNEIKNLYDFAFSKASNPNIAPAKMKANKTHVETLGSSISNMATRYTALRDAYHKKSIFHQWFTKEGWRESKAINAARKQMKETFGIKSDSAFNKIMKNISNKESDYLGLIKDALDESMNNYQNNQDAIINNLKFELEEKPIVISDELVNENSITEINTNKVENVKEDVIELGKNN